MSYRYSRLMRGSLAALALAALVSTAPATHAQTALNTVPGWTPAQGGISAFGEPGTSTYGQTFTVIGTDTVLTDYSVYVWPFNNTDLSFTAVPNVSVEFRLYGYQASGTGGTFRISGTGTPPGLVVNGTVNPISPGGAAAPEPGSLALIGLVGLPVVGAVVRHRRAA